ncbi:MAG: SEC-C domain-containing protein [Caldilineae bacterium]|nr:SEC-C domain-containing protein [Chloroflexota bacterium]MCB9176389.1 SEC-C domain-containing protein [Caldilineae bacterium]
MAMPGRNEPCHCGSGRKYKSCHWNADRDAARVRAEVERKRQEALEALGSPGEEEMRELYEQLTGRALPGDRVPENVRQTLVDMWRQQRLADGARERLAPHRAEIAARLDADPARFEQLASGLAGELDLSHFELTGTNVRKARRGIGLPPTEAAERRSYASRVLRLTLDADDRETFRDGLLAFLPELVDEGRFDEAYVLDVCAERALDPEAEACAFLEDVVLRSLS